MTEAASEYFNHILRPESIGQIIRTATIYPAAVYHAIERRLANKAPDGEMNVPLKLEIEEWVSGVLTGIVVCPIDNRKYRITVEVAE